MSEERRRQSQNAGRGQNGKKRKKKSKKKTAVLALIEIIVLIVVLLALAIYLKMGKVQKGDDIDVEALDIDETVDDVYTEGYTNIALFGLDNRANGTYSAGNSDVIIIASINNETKEVKLVSVYRDTYLNLEDGDDTYSKCNAAYNKGGVQEALKMIDNNLDLDITQYVCFDFNAVAEAVDQLGGVEVDVTLEEAVAMQGFIDEVAEMTGKTGTYLPGAGTYTLDGVQATAYARVRQTSGNDYKRTERQRVIIEKLFEKAKASDLSTLNDLIDTMLGYIETNLTTTEMLSIASKAATYEIADTTGFPFERANQTVDGKDCVIPCDLVTNVEELHKFLFENESYTPSNTVQSISDDIIYLTGLTADDATQEESENNY